MSYLLRFIAIAVMLFSATAYALSNFVDFSNVSELNLYGVSSATSTTDGAVIRLVDANPHQAGGVYTKTQQSINQFSTLFKVKVSNAGGTVDNCNSEVGGDGMTFVLSKNIPSLGGSGGGLGYAGLAESFAVEMDNHCDREFADPNSSHLGLIQNGVVKHVDIPNETANIAPDMENAQPWYVWVDYNGTTLEVRMNQSDSRPLDANLSQIIDLNNIVADSAYIGFTAATGTNYGTYDLLAWQFVSSYAPIGETTDVKRLSVTKIGSGTGTVTTVDGVVSGLNCGTRCVTYYDPATVVNLNAVADTQMRFVAWSGDADCEDGQVTLNSAVNCIAEFAAEQKQFELILNGAGVGKVTASGSQDGIACSLTETNCDEAYALGAEVTLTASLENSVFGGWTGDCNGTANPLTLTISQDTQCGVVFDLELKPVIGTGTAGFGGDGNPAQTALLNNPQGMAFDAQGQLYIADSTNHRIRKVDINGNITTVAGNGTAGFAGDGSSAILASLRFPSDVALDQQGRLYIADVGNHRIRRVNVSGSISTIAGTGNAGFNGETGLAVQTQLNNPYAVTVDKNGLVYIADSRNHRIRYIDASGMIHTVAGTGIAGFSGDGNVATNAQLNNPLDIIFDNNNQLYIADTNNHRIRKIDSSDLISTYAGSSVFGYTGDGADATAAKLNNPIGVAIDASGQLYISDQYNQRIRRVDDQGIIRTVAGNGSLSTDSSVSTGFQSGFNFPQGVAVDSDGAIFIADSNNHRVRSMATRLSGELPPTVVDGALTINLNGTGIGSVTSQPAGIDCGAQCSFIFSKDATITLTASVPDSSIFIGWSGDCSGSNLSTNVTLDTAKTCRATFEQVEVSGIVSTFAGNGTTGDQGNGLAALLAELNQPTDMVVDSRGIVYISDTSNHVIRQVDTDGIISIFAGTGTAGDSGDNKLASLAQLNAPQGLYMDANNTLYFADTGNHRIRKITADGFIAAVAGLGTPAFSGDGGLAVNAQLNNPTAIYGDNQDNLYIADTGNHAIRKITNGIISTIAGIQNEDGDPITGNDGDGTAANLAGLNSPNDIVVDANGVIYIADSGNQRIRIIKNDLIQAYAGTGGQGYSGDGGVASAATFDRPVALAIDAFGHLFVSDQNNARIRKIHINGTISTVVGTGTAGFNGDGSMGNLTLIDQPRGLNLDHKGNLYFIDGNNVRVRQVSGLSETTRLLGVNTVGNGRISSNSGLNRGLDCGQRCIETYLDNASVTLVAIPDADAIFSAWTGDCDSTSESLTFNLTSDKSCSAVFAPNNPILGKDIDTFAGIAGETGYTGDNETATKATLSSLLYSVVSDSQGNVYIADAANFVIRKVDTNGIISTFAGNNTNGNSGDGGLATEASFMPSSLGIDSNDNIYIGDSDHYVIRKIDTNGFIITIAGDGTQGLLGNGGPAKLAQLGSVFSIRFDRHDNLYFADTTNNQIRTINAQGIINVFAGSPTGIAGSDGDGGQATAATLNKPWSLVIDQQDNVYIADAGNFKIRKVSATGLINTFMGSGTESYQGDGNIVGKADIGFPEDLWIDADNILYVADSTFHLIRQVMPNNGVLDSNSIVSTLTGNGLAGFSGDGDLAENAQLNSPFALSSDIKGNLYIADNGNHVIRKISPTIRTYALNISKSGNGTGVIQSHDNALNCGLSCRAVYPQNSQVTLTVIPDDLMQFVAWSGDCSGTSSPLSLNLSANKTCVAQFAPLAGSLALEQINTLAGTGLGGFNSDGISATSAQLNYPAAVSVHQGVVYISDSLNNRIRAIKDNIISTFAGTGAAGFDGDNGHASKALLYNPLGLVWDSNNNLLFADNLNQRIRKIDSGVNIKTIAGTGQAGALGDNGQALLAQLNLAYDVAVDLQGNVFIADSINDRIRKVDSSGLITTVVGDGLAGFSGDDGLATTARLDFPTGIAVNNVGELYIADNNNHRIRKVDTQGIITTVAGTGEAGFAGDDDLATLAQLNNPHDVILTNDGSLLIADTNNQRVRKIDKAGIITTIAGTGEAGFGGDQGIAKNALFNQPVGLALDESGNLYIADQKNHRIRRISAQQSLIISKVGVGSGLVFSTDQQINCGEVCNVGINAQTSLTLVASPALNSYFAGWEGDCEGSSSQINLSVNSASRCQATFELSNTLPTCPDSGTINTTCNAEGRFFNTVGVNSDVVVYGGLVNATMENRGEVSNIQINTSGILKNGWVNGEVNNNGIIQDVIFQGKTLYGGTLAGRIDNIGGGLIQNVTLQSNSLVSGGQLSGTIVGSMIKPAIIQKLTVLADTRLTGVVIGEQVVLQEGVTLGEGVRFLDEDQLKQQSDINALVVKLPQQCSAPINGQTATLDLSTDLSYPETGLINKLQRLSVLNDNQWLLATHPLDDYLYVDIDVLRIALQPIEARFVSNAVNGLELFSLKKIRFTMNDLQIDSQATMQSLCELQILLRQLKLLDFTLHADNRFSVTWLSNPQIYFTAYPDWLSELMPADTVAGLDARPSPKVLRQMVYAHLFDDGENMRRQRFYPAPADPESLQSSTNNYEYQDFGVVGFDFEDSSYYGVLDYAVTKTTLSRSTLRLQAIDDANQDGINDVLITYPNGDTQILFVIPK